MFFEFAAAAVRGGINVAVSTNGSMIDDSAAARLSEAGVSYVGVSIDGPRDVHDRFRGIKGAFERSILGIKKLNACGCKTGLRVTLAKPLLPYLGEIMSIAEQLPVSRVCFYHFIPSGRGAGDPGLIPDAAAERAAIARIIKWTERAGRPEKGERGLEILTVGDASDGLLLYKYLSDNEDARARAARDLLLRSASRRTGAGIISVRWDGTVFPNQFDWKTPLGRWTELDEIRRQKRHDHGRSAMCEGCEWSSMCGGSLMPGAVTCCALTRE
jgi:MoaA/NifB/PqqE/SkfB family radical SAM enzyme